jgi:alkanesulfonate monooxygenase SsuD/methylene tetrahydromethanopterin reductase-like flavin-dependent oxidoreductase (luciferase family)
VSLTSVRFGLYLPPFGPLADPVALVELARRAEMAGWDGVFLWDHVLADGPIAVADPWVVLGAMATATSRVLLGTMVSPLPRRRPWVLARQAGTVSRLSGGRCVLGVGLGADEYGDFSRFGEQTDIGVRAAMTDEALEIIGEVWAGRPFSHQGPHYRVELPAGTPEPHRIPVWVAGTLPEVRSAHRAARFDGAVLLGTTTPETVARAVNALGANESRPFEVLLTGNASPAWDNPPDVDLGALAEAGMTWWVESLIHYDPLDLTMRVVDAGPPALG